MSQPPFSPGNPNGGPLPAGGPNGGQFQPTNPNNGPFRPGGPHAGPLPPQGQPPASGPYPGPGVGQQAPNGAAGPGQPPTFQGPAKKRKGKGCLIAVLIVIALIVVSAIAAAANGGKASSSSSLAAVPAPASGSGATAAGASTAPAKATTTAATIPGIGTAVAEGDLQFTVTAYKCGVTVKDYSGALTPQGQFCQLDVTIKNNGKAQATVDDSQIVLLDGAGVEYSTSSDTLMVDGTIFLKQINPGNSIKGSAYYDVPKEVNPTVAKVKGGLFSSGKQIKVA